MPGRSPEDDTVYRFMDKKRSEGKPYLVYMTAGANKFLCIYYGRVKEYLAALENADQPLPYAFNLTGACAAVFLLCPFSHPHASANFLNSLLTFYLQTCNTQSIAVSDRPAWRKHPSPLGTFPIFKQGLVRTLRRNFCPCTQGCDHLRC